MRNDTTRLIRAHQQQQVEGGEWKKVKTNNIIVCKITPTSSKINYRNLILKPYWVVYIFSFKLNTKPTKQ